MTELPPNEQPKQQVDALDQAENVVRLLDRLPLTFRLFFDNRVPYFPKLIPLLAIAYLLSPLDFLPELFAGPLAPIFLADDLSLLLGAIYLFVEASPSDIVAEHLRMMRGDSSAITDGDVVEGESEILE